MKKKNTKLKVLGVAAAMVMVMGATAVTTWAFTKTNVTSNFEATFIGARDVEATINGASYLASGETATKVEQISQIKFTAASTTENVTADFKQAITVVNENDYIYYEFSIKNNSEKTSYSDLIVNPVASITAGDTAVASGFYFSADNVTYTALGADYITIAKGDTIYLRLKAQLVDVSKDTNFKGSMQLNLYTEKSAPSNYMADYEYSITNGEAYKSTIYTDGNVGAPVKMQSFEYVIATPTTAQEIIDNNVNGKTIVFDAGTYGDLIFRPTLETVEAVYEFDAANPTVKGEEIIDLSYLLDFGSYHYNRSLQNIALVGTPEATFKGIIAFESAFIGGDTHTKGELIGYTDARTDEVRNMNVVHSSEAENVIGYISHMPINNLSFQDMKFEGKYGRIHFYASYDIELQNITIKDCEFKTQEPYLKYFETSVWNTSPIKLHSNSTIDFENIKLINNNISGHYQGIYVQNAKNIIIANNTISNSVHNAIAVQTPGTDGDNEFISGDIIIKNNTIDTTGVGVETGERAIRFGYGKNANIVIEGNTFKNCSEDRTGKTPSQGKQLLSSQTLTESTYIFTNNTFDGVEMEDVAGNSATFTIYTEEPVIA